MAHITPYAWQNLRQEAQDSILDRAELNWDSATQVTEEVRVTRLAHVKFGGLARLAYNMAAEALKWGEPNAARAPSQEQIFAKRLLDLSRVQRTKLFLEVLKPSVVRTRKDGTVGDFFQLSTRVHPSVRKLGQHEERDHINVLVNGRLGKAAVVVSLVRPINDYGYPDSRHHSDPKASGDWPSQNRPFEG